ncbi:hypothetical protein LXA43DRAFT_1102143 [Ganoderma leucocontextum]|nr:hypothetical protein LXA43DRAFT_1102143 [Ganoderma leucocontextum]
MRLAEDQRHRRDVANRHRRDVANRRASELRHDKDMDNLFNAYGNTLGVGYVTELLVPLAGTSVWDWTKHDAACEFLLSRALYADFVHENLIVPVFIAIRLFNISALPQRQRFNPCIHRGISRT